VLNVNCTVTPVEGPASLSGSLLIELQPIDQQLKASREERLIQQQQANRELIRNLAHEIKNPLGGIRGAAQLLEHELNNPANDGTKRDHQRDYSTLQISADDLIGNLWRIAEFDHALLKEDTPFPYVLQCERLKIIEEALAMVKADKLCSLRMNTTFESFEQKDASVVAPKTSAAAKTKINLGLRCHPPRSESRLSSCSSPSRRKLLTAIS